MTIPGPSKKIESTFGRNGAKKCVTLPFTSPFSGTNETSIRMCFISTACSRGSEFGSLAYETNGDWAERRDNVRIKNITTQIIVLDTLEME